MDLSASLAPAKLNLFLYIIGKRDDGYHNIVSLMQKVSLYDRISVSVEEGSTIDIRVSTLTGQGRQAPADKGEDRAGVQGTPGATGGIPVDRRNTAYTAAELFFGLRDLKKRKVSIEIEKHIPVEAGMGGASSDAACVLKALNRIMPSYSDGQLFELSKRVGSDVPFFMIEGAALASGRGDTIRPVRIECPLHYVVVKPDFGISTTGAYSQIKILTENTVPSMCDLAIYREDDIMRCLRNDLERGTGVYAPVIKTIKERLLSLGARAAMMTGSGSCVFGIFPGEQEAEAALEKASEEYASVYKVRGV